MESRHWAGTGALICKAKHPFCTHSEIYVAYGLSYFDTGGQSGVNGVLYLVAFNSESEEAKAKAAAYLASISETYWNEFDGIWFVKSGKDAVEIRNYLKLRC